VAQASAAEPAEPLVHNAGELKGRIRRIAIVALARKLMIALWRYVTTGLVPTGAICRQGQGI